MKEFIGFIVKSLVDNPDAVEIKEVDDLTIMDTDIDD